ncbi:MAG: GNAT family N-acetyltransferase [Rhodobacteraceae bacterium]|nr:GNAT family N-acetyltransferase [Paracoccaceae bacterium]
MTVERLEPDQQDQALADLTDILHTSVLGGASVGFILPFSPEAAASFWRDKVFPAVRSGGAHLFVLRDEDKIIGTVQLGLDLPPNQPHRADVAKLLVHPDHRRKGVARKLMLHLEAEARSLSKTLLVLDTRSGDPSQSLYASLGFQVAGEVPGFCRNPFEERFEPTTYMYKALT